MNAMGDEPERDGEPEIILIGLENRSYYLYKGDEFLNQLLLADGEFPTPILCVNFDTVFDVHRVLGETLSLSGMWGVHPDIVKRLRDTNCLIETTP